MNDITGYLTKTNNSPYWQMIIKADGKEHWKTTKETKKFLAKQKMNEELTKLRLNRAAGVIPKDIVLTEYVKNWINTITVKQTTQEHYSSIINNHIIGYKDFSILKLDEIKPSHIRAFIKHLKEKPTAKGTPLSDKSIKNIFGVLSKSLEDAYLDDLIISNPCRKVKVAVPQVKEQPILTLEQMKQLLTFVKNTEYELIIHILCYGAMRRGEILALKFSDVNYEQGYVYITENRTRFKKEVVGTPKTPNSVRKIYLPELIINEIKAEKKRHEELEQLLGDEYIKNDYIFKSNFGQPYSVNAFTRKVKAILKKSGVPNLSPHRLRATAATLMLNSDEDISISDISALLGHSNVLITQKYYARYLDSSRVNTMRKMQRLLDV